LILIILISLESGCLVANHNESISRNL